MGMIVQSKYWHLEELGSCILESKTITIYYLTIEDNSGVTKLVSHLMCWFFFVLFFEVDNEYLELRGINLKKD